MPKKSGIIFVILGAVLMLSALLLFLYNGYEDRRAGAEAEILLDDIQAVIEQKPAPTPLPEETTPPAPENAEPAETLPQETHPPEMPEVMIKGYAYIGYLSIPELELQLPVMSQWDYDRLNISPCRHFGSSRTDDLVIAAHNYKTHFGSLSSLQTGTKVYFTDMDGIQNEYSLERLDTLAADAVDEVQNSGFDLVLYTCTPGGKTRVVAFLDRTASQSSGDPQ